MKAEIAKLEKEAMLDKMKKAKIEAERLDKMRKAKIEAERLGAVKAVKAAKAAVAMKIKANEISVKMAARK